MKFRWKIFVLCIGIFLTALILTCVVITEGNYRRLMKNEVERYIKEEENVHDSITQYLYANRRINNEEINIRNYGSIIVDMFGKSDTMIELYDNNGRKLQSNVQWAWGFNRKEINSAINMGKNFILRWYRGKHYLFITDKINVDNDTLIISFIKDITNIDMERKNQYIFFIKTLVIGLLITAIAAMALTRRMIRPIDMLNKAAGRIASGKYNERVQSKGSDEISQLGQQFNIMAEEIQEKISQLRVESERKQRFIDNLTHELRTPLTSVIGYSDLLMKLEYDKEMFDKSIMYINSEGNRMFRMINKLMDLIVTRQGSLKLEKANAIIFLNEVAEIIKPKAQQSNIQMEVTGKDLILEIDRDLMKEAVLNLVDNAINASEFGDKIIIGVQLQKDKKYIFVKDEGKGMKKEDALKVLEPFYRVDKSRSRKEGGLGLGLSLCSEIATAHGAILDIQSNIDEGTTAAIIFSNE